MDDELRMKRSKEPINVLCVAKIKIIAAWHEYVLAIEFAESGYNMTTEKSCAPGYENSFSGPKVQWCISVNVWLFHDAYSAFHQLRGWRNGTMPLMPGMKFALEDLISFSDRGQAGSLQIGIDHNTHQFGKTDARFPSQETTRLSAVSDQAVDFSRTKVFGIGLDVFLPI